MSGFNSNSALSGCRISLNGLKTIIVLQRHVFTSIEEPESKVRDNILFLRDGFFRAREPESESKIKLQSQSLGAQGIHTRWF